MVTNAHVVSGGGPFQVTTASGRAYRANVVGTFAPDDLAVVRAVLPDAIQTSAATNPGNWQGLKRMTGHRLVIRPLSRQRWTVAYEGDPTPLSEHPTLAEARRAAINHARQFGEPTIHVCELDGEEHEERVDPDFPAPTPRDLNKASADPR